MAEFPAADEACWFAVYQQRVEKRWLVRCLILLPCKRALAMMSLTQAAGSRMAAPAAVFS